MNKFKIYLNILILMSCHLAQAYVTSKTSDQVQIKWPSNTSQIDVYFNPANSYGVSESTLQNIATASANQWNNITNITLSMGTTAGKNQNGLNEVFFTDDATVFNSSNISVMALTQVSYNNTNGKIIEADVLINQNNLIYTSQTAQGYIGNIITHELGHLLGLDHSTVIGSTMFWALSFGQNQIADDDRAGLFSIYSNSNSSYRSLSGKVIGGKNLLGVFGVEVQAISQATGKIMGATLSELDGTFTIKGLPVNDKYFIYTRPAVVGKLPAHFSSTRSNFCDEGKSFRGSFFQACGGSSEGYPQAVAISSSDVNVGNVSIRCTLDVPPVYFQKKTNSETDYNPLANTQLGIGNSFVGFFSSQSVENAAAVDNFKIDLTSLTSANWNNLSSSNLYLSVQVLNQSFFSPYQADLSIVAGGTTTYTAPKMSQAADGWYSIDSHLYIPIDKVTKENNFFNVRIAGNTLTSLKNASDEDIYKRDILPDYSEFQDPLYFYFFNSQIVTRNVDGSYTPVSARNYNVTDNSSCTDAVNTYALTSYTTTGAVASDSKKNGAIACGTINTNGDDNKNGPIGMIVGFSLAFVIIALSKRAHFI